MQQENIQKVSFLCYVCVMIYHMHAIILLIFFLLKVVGYGAQRKKESGRLVQHEIGMLVNLKIHSHEKNETLY